MYEIGSPVVNKNTMAVGTIVEARTHEDQLESSGLDQPQFKIQYESGGTEWVSMNDISRLLLEVDDDDKHSKDNWL